MRTGWLCRPPYDSDVFRTFPRRGCAYYWLFRFVRCRRALARVCGTIDGRRSTRTSRAPMLKFVQWSVLKLLMPYGRREGLKASPLLLLGYK